MFGAFSFRAACLLSLLRKIPSRHKTRRQRKDADKLTTTAKVKQIAWKSCFGFISVNRELRNILAAVSSLTHTLTREDGRQQTLDDESLSFFSCFEIFASTRLVIDRF